MSRDVEERADFEKCSEDTLCDVLIFVAQKPVVDLDVDVDAKDYFETLLYAGRKG